ncbi:uncharacterized protein ACBT44_006669 [Syngnathus typhle]
MEEKSAQLDWVRNPFLLSEAKRSMLPVTHQEKLMEVASDRGLQMKFGASTLTQFWVCVRQEHPELGHKSFGAAAALCLHILMRDLLLCNDCDQNKAKKQTEPGEELDHGNCLPATKDDKVRILFVDFSLAFNTIAPDILHQKLIQFAMPDSTCQWITSFLTNRRQHVRLGTITSDTRTTNTGAPQGCVLSPLLFSLYTNDYSSGDSSVKKYADDTTPIGLIRDGDEIAYRQEVERLVHSCSQNHLELNPLKTVEMTMDFRRHPSPLPPLTIHSNTILSTDTFKFLSSTISRDLKWTSHIDSFSLLSETAQEVQPATGAAEDLLYCHHPVYSLHLHHCLVWIGHQTRQALTATDNQDCRKDNRDQPPIYPGLVPVQDQETCK